MCTDCPTISACVFLWSTTKKLPQNLLLGSTPCTPGAGISVV